MARSLRRTLAAPLPMALVAAAGLCIAAAGCHSTILGRSAALGSRPGLFREETKNPAFREAVRDDAFPTAAQAGVAPCDHE